jgi:aspartyl-tRNA(Asn)/glutamyl-tRNA(Gln) amidotransferase subunit A
VDAPTSGQSHARLELPSDARDAGAVAALRAAGAVIVGKTSLSELAIGLPEPDPVFPLPRNPWRRERWAGGSSAGSASGLAAGFFLGALGSDTGGSIRIPAAFCGVSGLKPTRGLVSLEGCLPLAPSLDTVGPMARSAADCALLLEALTGGRAPAGAAPDGLARVRIGVERAHLGRAGVEPSALEAFETALGVLEGCGAELVEVELPGAELAAVAAGVVIGVEGLEIHRAALAERWSLFGRSTRLRLAAGAFYDEGDYARALERLARARTEIGSVLAGLGALVTLTTGGGALPLEGMALDAPSSAPFFTRLWSGLGVPALSVPMGFDRDGLPLGLQIIAGFGRDSAVLGVGQAFQAATRWHLERPQLA